MTYHEERFPDDYGIEVEGNISVYIENQQYLYNPVNGWCVSTNTINEFSTTVERGLQGEAIVDAIAVVVTAKAARLAAEKADYLQREEAKWEEYRKTAAALLPKFPLWKGSVNQRCFYLWMNGEKKGFIPFYGEVNKLTEEMSAMEASVNDADEKQVKLESLRKAGKPIPKHLR
jgi:hypothetical protein